MQTSLHFRNQFIYDVSFSCSGFSFVDAFATTVYVTNKLLSSFLKDKSPLETLFRYATNYANFNSFSYRVYSYLRDYASNKLVPQSHSCIFFGYSSSYKGFCYLDPNSSRVFITRHAQFDEFHFPFSQMPSSTPANHLDVSNFLDGTSDVPSSRACSLPHGAICSPYASPR